VDTQQKRCCAAAAICAHWSWDNCVGGIDTGVFCLLSDVIKAVLYYVFVLLVCGLFSSGARSPEHVTSNGKVKVSNEWETLCGMW
jgi:hypothetical protein